MFRICVTLIVSLFAVYISDCAHHEDGIQEEMPVSLVGVSPPNGSELGVNNFITLTFDNTPTDVTVTSDVPAKYRGAANSFFKTVFEKTVLISVPFHPGSIVDFTVTWKGGSKTLNFHFPGL